MKAYSIITAIYLAITIGAPAHAGILDFFKSKSPEDTLKEELHKGFNSNRQKLFDCFHPVGTAKSVEVHEVKIAWKNDRGTKDAKNMLGYTVRFTIYWRGPVTADGFTKVIALFDNESKRYIESKILATNGVTNDQATGAATDFLGGLLEGLMKGQ